MRLRSFWGRGLTIALAMTICGAAWGAGPRAGNRLADAAMQGEAAPVNDLFVVLSMDYKPDDIAANLANAIRRSGRDCDRVSDFQIFDRTEHTRTLKVKCPGMEIYGLSIWREGQTQVYGGDGMVAPFDLDDGEIVTVYGSPIQSANHRDRRRISDSHGLSTVQVTERRSMPLWLILTIAINAVLLALLISIGLLFWKAEGRRTQQVLETVGRISSEEKDVMIEEAQEVLPDIFQHPRGLFIVRGRHGKRRLFRNMLFALAYRDWGVKLREIR